MQLESFLADWRQVDGGVQRSNSFLSYVGPDGALRNTANAAFLARLYQKAYAGADKKLDCWAEYQGRALVGDGLRSYVVGTPKHNPPTQAQHRVRHNPVPLPCPGNCFHQAPIFWACPMQTNGASLGCS